VTTSSGNCFWLKPNEQKLPKTCTSQINRKWNFSLVIIVTTLRNHIKTYNACKWKCLSETKKKHPWIECCHTHFYNSRTSSCTKPNLNSEAKIQVTTSSSISTWTFDVWPRCTYQWRKLSHGLIPFYLNFVSDEWVASTGKITVNKLFPTMESGKVRRPYYLVEMTTEQDKWCCETNKCWCWKCCICDWELTEMHIRLDLVMCKNLHYMGINIKTNLVLLWSK